MVRRLPALLLVAVSCQTSSASSAGRSLRDPQPIHPKLDHDTHEDFVKDLAKDVQPNPGPGIKFDHPYPSVQESSEYDKDYPKDENGDGGEWESQMQYDIARTRVRRTEAKEADARKDMEKSAKELERLRVKDEKATKVANEAAAKVARIKDAIKEAEEQLKALGNGTASSQPKSDAVKAAEEGLAKAQKNLEGCQERLAKAKAALEKMLEQQEKQQRTRAEEATKRAEEATERSEQQAATAEAATASHAADSAAQVIERAKTAAERAGKAGAALDEAKEELKESEEALKEVEQVQKVAHEQVSKQQKDVDKAVKKHEKAAADLQTAHDDVGATGDKLRKFRQVPGDNLRSGAMGTRVMGALTAAVVVLASMQ